MLVIASGFYTEDARNRVEHELCVNRNMVVSFVRGPSKRTPREQKRLSLDAAMDAVMAGAAGGADTATVVWTSDPMTQNALKPMTDMRVRVSRQHLIIAERSKKARVVRRKPNSTVTADRR